MNCNKKSHFDGVTLEHGRWVGWRKDLATCVWEEAFKEKRKGNERKKEYDF